MELILSTAAGVAWTMKDHEAAWMDSAGYSEINNTKRWSFASKISLFSLWVYCGENCCFLEEFALISVHGVILYVSSVWKRPLDLSNKMNAYQYFNKNPFPKEVCLPFELLLKKPLQYLLATVQTDWESRTEFSQFEPGASWLKCIPI